MWEQPFSPHARWDGELGIPSPFVLRCAGRNIFGVSLVWRKRVRNTALVRMELPSRMGLLLSECDLYTNTTKHAIERKRNGWLTELLVELDRDLGMNLVTRVPFISNSRECPGLPWAWPQHRPLVLGAVLPLPTHRKHRDRKLHPHG